MNLSHAATLAGPDFPQIITLELHSNVDGWQLASIISGNGTVDWLIQDAGSDQDDDLWRWTFDDGQITPPPLIPQSGAIF